MRTTPLLVFLLLALASKLNAQACDVSTDTVHLDVNNARVILQASGDFFWDREKAGYFVPKGNPGQAQTSTLFAGGLWLGGLDSGGNLKLSAQTYGAGAGQPEWWPGPLSPHEGTSNFDRCKDFDRLWKITRGEIVSHIADFSDNGVIDGPVPDAILKWPGRNNPSSLSANGFELPDQELAPFEDRNNNGVYEPWKGDYPRVLGDEAIWWVFNDEGGGSGAGEMLVVPIRAEVHALAYAFAGEGNEDLANTTFYNMTIYNQANEYLDSTYIGFWLDASLGCGSDDYVGCISSEKMAFMYNGDGQDGQTDCSCEPDMPTYCEDMPITAIKVLKGPLSESGEDVGFSSFKYINPAILTTTNTTWAPDVQTYWQMTDRWGDGSRMVYGGNGHDPTSTDYHPYAMDGNPADPLGWSFCTENYAPGDFSMLIGSGPFRLDIGESTSICYAVMTKFGIPQPCPDITPLIEMGKAVESYCAAGLTPICEVIPDATVQVYPNPILREGKIITNTGMFERVNIYNSDGQLMRSYPHLMANELTLERGMMSTGFYYYSALLNNGQLVTGKLVVR